uniref:Expressed conserved protein n=1 Tax=Echinococcus granulosus TaxID=6210 RepID=A0A068WNS6_ECHGR|nr:hypothetical protein EgrG_000455800 [Echinococcus granulosus]
MGRKNSSSQLPIDHFRRAIGDNQRRRQVDQVVRMKTSTDKKNKNKQVEFIGSVQRFGLSGHSSISRMEWDDVETNGLLQPFETSVIAALVELRQKHWKECTNVINNIRKLIRRQLKSLHMTKTFCKKCYCEVVAPEIQADKIPTELNNPRKRTRFNLSISSSLESSANDLTPPGATSAFLHRQPSEKRLCLATTNGQLAVNLNRSKSKETNEGSNILVAETQDDFSPPVDDSQHDGKDSDLVSHRPIGLATFSPPSQLFDASLALRRAVNHLDLANYEPSTIAPLPPIRSKQFKFKNGAQKVHSSRRAHKRTCRHYQPQSREVEVPKGRPKPIVATDMLSDATGADLTFPSISAVALATDVPSCAPPAKSLMLPPPPPPPDAYSTRITRRMSKKPSVDVLPSVGRSPTRERNIETQLNESQDYQSNNDVGDPDVPEPMAATSGVPQVRQTVRYSREDIEKCLRGPESHQHSIGNAAVALPSTPDGYWSVGNPDAVSPGPGVVQPAGELAVRRLRRRRPLEFPKPPT